MARQRPLISPPTSRLTFGSARLRSTSRHRIELADTADALKFDDSQDAVVDQQND
jgi:hypothetical protein